jgi:dihydropteroate synthase
VIPVVRELAVRGIPVSIDTLNAATARAAFDAGASIINDVSGGLADTAMASVAAETGATFIAMHWRGPSSTMQQRTEYTDVVAEVRDHLAARIDALEAAGVSRDRIVIDPGIGFAKTIDQNWLVLGQLEKLVGLAPVLVGASRKRFLGELFAPGTPTDERDLPTAVISALSAGAGAWGVRVHDVAATRAALAVAALWAAGAHPVSELRTDHPHD